MKPEMKQRIIRTGYYFGCVCFWVGLGIFLFALGTKALCLGSLVLVVYGCWKLADR